MDEVTKTPVAQEEPLPFGAALALRLYPHDKIVMKPKVKRPKQDTVSPFGFKVPLSSTLSIVLGALGVAVCLSMWWYVTNGDSQERIIGPASLPSPMETFNKEQLHDLWVSSALPANLWASIKRVVMGFALATAIGVPLGIVCGCYPWINALFFPINVFGRNVPIAALIPVTFALFGIAEFQKVMFIFCATVAFIMMDTATAINDVADSYIDTGLTLGANRRQIVTGVLTPLAMPRIFNSLRLLFGLAFGYIMLAELVTIGGNGGLGFIINTAQRRGHRETIILVLVLIPAVALLIDRCWFAIQKSLFPYQYGGKGTLHGLWRSLNHGIEDVKQQLFVPKQFDASQLAIIAARAKSGTK